MTRELPVKFVSATLENTELLLSLREPIVAEVVVVFEVVKFVVIRFVVLLVKAFKVLEAYILDELIVVLFTVLTVRVDAVILVTTVLFSVELSVTIIFE